MGNGDQTDAIMATRLIKKYLVDTHGPIADFTFRLIAVSKNTQEHVWIVKCRILNTPKDTEPTDYTIKVNVKTGEMVKVNSSLEQK